MPHSIIEAWREQPFVDIEAGRMPSIPPDDVRTGLCPRGAAGAFGPQKGASPRAVAFLEQGMGHYGRRLFEACAGLRAANTLDHQRQFDAAAAHQGAGAAGGIGFALQQLLMATTMNGVEMVMRCVNFDDKLTCAELVITGEGKLDESSFEGKVVTGVIERAAAKGIPVYAICGQSALDATDCARRGISHVETLLDQAIDVDDAKKRVLELLVAAGQRLASRF